MATVSKRKWTHNSVEKEAWVVRYTDHGGKERLKTFRSKKEADRGRLKIETELSEGTHTADRRSVTMGEATTAWLDECDRRHRLGGDLAGTTLRNYRNIARVHVVPQLGKLKLTELTSLRLQDHINDKANRLSRATCGHIKIVLMQTFRNAVRRQWLRRNPMVDDPIRIPRAAPVRKVVPPNRQDIETLLRSLTGIRRSHEQELARQNRLVIVMLGLFAGMRRGEICGLQWESVDLERGIVQVKHSYSKEDGLKAPKTVAGMRDIPMAYPVRCALESMARFTGGQLTGYVLRTRDGRHPHPEHVGGYIWRALMQRAGLVAADGKKPKFSMHAMRHAAVSLLIEQGLDPFIIKGIIGHSKITTTLDVYGHLLPENQTGRRAVMAVGDRYRAVVPLVPLPAPAEMPPPLAKNEWNHAKERALALFAEGMQVTDIARHLSVSFSSVKNWLRDNGSRADIVPTSIGQPTLTL